MIRFEKVNKAYGSIHAVKDLSFEISEHELCVLIGPSGCGKTSTLKMINRLTSITRGAIYVNGKNIKDVKPDILRRGMGYVIQTIGLFPHMSVFENIATVPRLLKWGRAKISRRVDELLELTGLPVNFRSKYPHELSGGQAQRIGVARALAADPPILLMDEPFGAVDPLNRLKLQNEFLRLQREIKKTTVFVTHDIDEAIRLADKVAILEKGVLKQYDTPDVILENPADKFVHDFIGTDRALKNLIRKTVGDFMCPPQAVSLSDTKSTVDEKVCRNAFLWVTDKNGRCVGWLHREEYRKSGVLAEAMTELPPGEGVINPDATLRDALSRMIEYGGKTLAVIGRDGKLAGTIGIDDIRSITGENNQ